MDKEIKNICYKYLESAFERGLRASPMDANNSEYHLSALDFRVAPEMTREILRIVEQKNFVPEGKFMERKLCEYQRKSLGHKWEVAFISGWYEEIRVKFIGAYCRRCSKGYSELIDATDKMTNRIYGTYSEEYFDRDPLQK